MRGCLFAFFNIDGGNNYEKETNVLDNVYFIRRIRFVLST